jgi:NitT/TauT family transport system ATP-binding protein
MVTHAQAAVPTDGQTRPPKIVVEGLSKTFQVRGGLVQALSEIDLVIPDGQFCVIVGPSGCGKTTLLRILAGLEEHTQGRIEMLHADPRRPLTSMVFQEQSIFPWMSVYDNVAYGLRMRGVPERQSRELVEQYIEKVGLTQFRKAYPHQLSGGMKQRVSVARAFANEPEILLMDEPFGALDEQNKSLLHEEVLRIWEESRRTVLFITHSIDEALVLGDRVLVMTRRVRAESQPGIRGAVVRGLEPAPRRGDAGAGARSGSPIAADGRGSSGE